MLKIALLTNGNTLSKVESDLVDLAEQSNEYDVSLIIQTNLKKNKENTLAARFVSAITKTLYWFIKELESFLLQNNIILKNLQEFTLIKSLEIPHYTVEGSLDKNSLHFSRIEIDELKKQEIDLVVSCHFNNLKNNFHLFSRFGLLEILYGSHYLQKLKNYVTGLDEILEKNPITTFEILYNKKIISQSESFARGSIATVFLFILNKYSIERKAMFFLHNQIEKLHINKTFYKPSVIEPNSNLNSPAAIYQSLNSPPPINSLIRYLFSLIDHIIKRIFSKLLRLNGEWRVGFIRNPKDWKNLNFNKLNILPNTPNHYYADPFLFSHHGCDYCFVEDYSFSKQKGTIRAYLLDENNFVDQGTVLEEPFHLSYPNIFKIDDEIFMIPESGANNDIRLYKCINFPSEWALHKQLIKNISAVDTNIFFHENKWWMFTNIDSSDLGDYCSELHIFYANNFDSENWQPHSKNPVLTNALHARNAGCVLDKSELFRAFQVQGYNFYGKSIGISKIITLTQDKYSESIVHSIQPKFIKNIHGTHHIHYTDRIMAIDFFEK